MKSVGGKMKNCFTSVCTYRRLSSQGYYACSAVVSTDFGQKLKYTHPNTVLNVISEILLEYNVEISMTMMVGTTMVMWATAKLEHWQRR